MQSDDQWHITITTIPDYRSDTVLFSAIEQSEVTAARLPGGTTITIPLPKQSGPITEDDQQPLWLRFEATAFKATEPETAQQIYHPWHAPRLTPHMAELQRKARLAERMADRAFYFGYDTNEDALK